MNIKEIIKTTEQLNEKDKKKRIVLIFIASLFAMAAAIYSVFHNRKSAKADEVKSAKARRQSRVNKVSASKKRRAQTGSGRSASAQGKEAAAAVENTTAPAVQQPVVTVPRQVYIVRPLPKEKQESKTHRFKRHMCAAVAVILVVSLVGSGAMSYVPPTTVLAAKSSFSGIGRVVAEHSNEPYVILDIVPTVAKYTENDYEYEFSTGTLGYLVDGEASIAQDLIHYMLNNPKFYNYSDRQNLISAVGANESTFPEITYKEYYEGIDKIPESWRKMFDSAEGTSGVLKAKVEYSEKGGDGYDFTYSGPEEGKFRDISLLGEHYEIDVDANVDEGAYSLSFYASGGSDDTVGGYIYGGELGRMSSNSFTRSTNVYCWEDGVLVWKGTIESVIRENYGSIIRPGEDKDKEKEEEKDKEKEEEKDKEKEEEKDKEKEDEEKEDEEDVDSDKDDELDEDKPSDVEPDEGGDEDGNEPGEGGTVGGNEYQPGEGSTEGNDEYQPGEGSTGGNNEYQPGEGSTGGNNEYQPGEGGTEGGGEHQSGEGSTGDDGSTGNGVEAQNISDETASRKEPVFNEWRKLVEDSEVGNYDDSTSTDEEENGYTDDENNVNPDESQEIDWDAVDWDSFSDYVIVAFTYTEDTEGKVVYQIGSEEKITDEGNRPYDSYVSVEAEVSENPDIMTLALVPDSILETDSGDVDGIFEYNPGKGQYKLERVTGSAAEEGDVYTLEVKNVSVYFMCSSPQYDWLKEYVFGTSDGGDNENSSFEIEVNTVRADEVTPDMIRNADLIYLESGNNNLALGLQLSSIIGSDAADMDDDVVNEILQRATEDLMPVIVDYDIVGSSNYTDSNYQYLAKAMLKRDLTGFYDEIRGSNLMDNLRMNITSDDYPDKKDNNYNYVNQNVYIVNDSSPLVAEDFRYEFDDDTARAGFSDVLSAIKAENTMRSEDDKISEKVSKARAVQYIINFSVGIVGELGDLSILELQPTANTETDLFVEDTGDGGAKLVWKTPSMTTAKQVLSSKNSFSIARKDVKAVVEFNSEWEDINGIYDFVFIGLDGQKLNKNDDGKTVYNESALNGKVYHNGDGAYDANDITVQKMNDLLEFMAAGYPVLVENDCFKDGTAQKAKGSDDINTDYIDSDTFMYRFLSAALTDDYKDYIYTVSDAMAGSMFITQVKMARPRISLVADENGADYNQYLSEDENGEYHGRIAYAVTSNKSNDDGYDDYYGNTIVRLYADFNYDGIYAADEEVTEYTNEGGVIDLEVTGMGPGILPWKLEVSDEINANRRDSVEGYFVIGSSATSSKGELNVLQIMANTDDVNANLQTMFYKSTNSMLAYYLSGAESTLHTDMQFETVTPAELEIRLAENENYLEQWDVVVVTLDGLDLGGTVEKIEKYVNDGRSLLVCGSATSGDNRAGLTAALLGQTDERTFVDLGVIGEQQRYAGLNGGMYEPIGGAQAERVNNGSISYYPYVIGENSVDIGASVAVKASAYLLDFDNNLKSDGFVTYVTPWYTIGGGSNTAYGISPKDGRNNYYCYSKGNVVYLAQSSYPYATGDEGGVGECEFFVNALVAAYSAGVHNANVHIVAGFASDSADVESIAVPFDDVWIQAEDDNTGGILDNTVDVYFRFRDSNIAMNKNVKIEFLYEDSTGPEFDVGGKIVNAQQFESPIWMVENNRLTLVQPDELEPGKTYRIQAPVVTLQNDSGTNKADIYIVIESSFIRNGRQYNVISSDSVSLNRAQLFLLE